MVNASFIIAIFALVVAVVALPTVFQMWWGKPKVHVEFNQEVDYWGKALSCRIINAPIDSKFLRIIGVSRQDATDIAVTFHIKDITGNIIAKVKPQRREEDGRVAQDSRVPGSRNYRWVSIVVWRNNNRDVVIAMPEPAIPLPNGEYIVDIEISSTELIHKIGKFKVGQKCDELQWS